MALNIIDISDHQATMDIAKVFQQNPLAGAVVKATQGTYYVNKYYCDPWIQWLIKNKKLWGFYHFLEGSPNAAAEAKYFVQHCKNYFGKGLCVADWEEPAYLKGTDYLYDFLKEVFVLTGVKPVVYIRQGLVAQYKTGLTAIAGAGYKLWLAQYASNNPSGLQANPWQGGSIYPWEDYIMHQYSDHGRLNGYSFDLDLNLFYGTEDDWWALAQSNEVKPVPAEPVYTPSRDEIIAQIMDLLEKLR